MVVNAALWAIEYGPALVEEVAQLRRDVDTRLDELNDCAVKLAMAQGESVRLREEVAQLRAHVSALQGAISDAARFHALDCECSTCGVFLTMTELKARAALSPASVQKGDQP